MNRNLKQFRCISGFLLLLLNILLIPAVRLSLPQDDSIGYYFNQNRINAATDPTAFISVWDTTKLSSGSSASNQVQLPLLTE